MYSFSLSIVLSYLFKRTENSVLRSRNPEDINSKQQTTPANYSYVFFNLFPNIMCTQTLYLCRYLFLFNCKKKVSNCVNILRRYREEPISSIRVDGINLQTHLKDVPCVYLLYKSRRRPT